MYVQAKSGWVTVFKVDLDPAGRAFFLIWQGFFHLLPIRGTRREKAACLGSVYYITTIPYLIPELQSVVIYSCLQH